MPPRWRVKHTFTLELCSVIEIDIASLKVKYSFTCARHDITRGKNLQLHLLFTSRAPDGGQVISRMSTIALFPDVKTGAGWPQSHSECSGEEKNHYKLSGIEDDFTVVGWVTINTLTPNVPCSGRTAPLTSKRFILYIYSTNIGTEYFKHGINSPFLPLKMQFVS